MKKVISLLFAFIIVLSITAGMTLSAYAETGDEETLVCDDYTYVFLEDGTAEITGYIGDATDLSIPAELDGHTVTSIGENAFWQCANITSVEIPDCVANLGDNAFFRCGNLESVAIGNGVSVIGYRAFYGCVALKNLTISNGVSKIGEMTFSNCTSLTEVVLPDSVIAIDDRAFAFCTSLESIKIPDGLTYLSSSAFEACSSLKSIVIPAGIKKMEFYQFSGCESLKSIYIMNKDLVFGESRWPFENATIYGYKGSTAQAYAENNGIKFVAFDEDSEEPSTEEVTKAPTTEKPNIESNTEASTSAENDFSKSPDTGAAVKGMYAFAAIALAGGAFVFVKKKEQ